MLKMAITRRVKKLSAPDHTALLAYLMSKDEVALIGCWAGLGVTKYRGCPG